MRASGRKGRGLALHAILGAGVLLSLFPFYWMVVMATNRTEDIRKFPPKLTIGSELGANVAKVFDRIDFAGAMLNSLIIACAVTALVLFFDSLAAFTFAKFEFPAKRLLFGVLIGTYLLPVELAVIPKFVIMVRLGWVGSYQALIVPAAANVFGIFWLRQYTEAALDDELLAAARIDGCGFFRQYRHLALPIMRPGLAFLGIYVFMTAWNDYFWPLVVFSTPGNTTLQVALAKLNVAFGVDYGMLMAGALLAVVPLVVAFLLFARSFVADIAKGALD